MGYYRNGAWYPTEPLKLKNCKMEFEGKTMMCDIELDGFNYNSQDDINLIDEIVANQGCETKIQIEDHINFEKGKSNRISDKLKDLHG